MFVCFMIAASEVIPIESHARCPKAHFATLQTGGVVIATGLFDRVQDDVLEPNHHRGANVQLEGNHPALGRFVALFVKHFCGHLAVDEVLQMIASGDNVILIPFVGLDDLAKVFLGDLQFSL